MQGFYGQNVDWATLAGHEVPGELSVLPQRWGLRNLDDDPYGSVCEVLETCKSGCATRRMNQNLRCVAQEEWSQSPRIDGNAEKALGAPGRDGVQSGHGEVQLHLWSRWCRHALRRKLRGPGKVMKNGSARGATRGGDSAEDSIHVLHELPGQQAFTLPQASWQCCRSCCEREKAPSEVRRMDSLGSVAPPQLFGLFRRFGGIHVARRRLSSAV